MICFADSDKLRADLLEILRGQDLLHASILSTWYAAFPQGSDSAQFWVCYDSVEIPRAVLLRTGEEFLLCDGGLTEFEEIAEFLNFMDCSCLVAREKILQPVAEKICLQIVDASPAMAYQGGSYRLDPDVHIAEENLREVYQLIVENYESFNKFHGNSYDNWLSTLRIRQRDGISAVYALYDGPELVATASFVSSSERSADIGSVVVRKDLRGRGLGQKIVRHMIALAERFQKTPILGCANEQLAQYYTRLGFVQYDRWGVAEVKND